MGEGGVGGGGGVDDSCEISNSVVTSKIRTANFLARLLKAEVQ